LTRSGKGPQRLSLWRTAFEIRKNQTTHTEVGADYPRKLRPRSGAPAAVFLAAACGATTAATDPG
jgi:hypothetical protein